MADPTPDLSDPVQIEKLADPSGKGEQWKIMCACGKRMMTPLQPSHSFGRCPKCGRRLRLPGYVHLPGVKAAPPTQEKSNYVDAREVAKQRKRTPPAGLPALLEAPAHATAAASSAGSGEGNPLAKLPPDAPDEEIGTIVIDPDEEPLLDLSKDMRGHDAAIIQADKMRAKKVRASDGRLISAWPRAGRLPRCVAGLIDFTLSAMTAGATACLGLAGVLPSAALHPLVLLTAFFSVAMLNDLVLQFFGGSLGKRLARITLRDKDGKEPGPGLIMARAALKWLIFPGWPLALFDPDARCLHDVVLGTVALKSRK